MSYQNMRIVGHVGRKVNGSLTNTDKQVANFSDAVNEKIGDEMQTT